MSAKPLTPEERKHTQKLASIFQGDGHDPVHFFAGQLAEYEAQLDAAERRVAALEQALRALFAKYPFERASSTTVIVDEQCLADLQLLLAAHGDGNASAGAG